MYGINWPQLIAGIILLVAVIHYIYVLLKTKDDSRFDYLFAHSSQLTFITFILGFAIVIIMANASEVSAGDLSNWVMIFGACVGLVNMLSLIYYQYRQKKDNKKN